MCIGRKGMEERTMTKGNPDRTTVTRAQNRGQTSSGLDRIREAEQRLPVWT